MHGVLWGFKPHDELLNLNIPYMFQPAAVTVIILTDAQTAHLWTDEAHLCWFWVPLPHFW